MIRILSILVFIHFLSCYSFKGISIDPDVSTFVVENVDDVSGASPANYPIEFGLAMSNKIRRETRLNLNTINPDLKFKCTISQFTIESIAPVAGQTTAVNRVSVRIKVECTNTIHESKNWSSEFTKFEDFSAAENFVNVQTTVLNNINRLILEDIFNKAFSDWQ